MRLKVIRRLSSGFAVLLMSVPLSEAQTQTRSLTWTESSRVEVSGALGLVLRATGGLAPTETRNALHLQGRSLVQQSGSTTTVMDLEGGRWLMVDDDDRTYSVVTFEEMAQLSREALQGAFAGGDASSADAAAAREELKRSLDEAGATLQFRVSAEPTGVRQRIGSHDAVKYIVTTEFEASAAPEGVDEPEGGTLLFLAELWQVTGVQSERAIYEEWSRLAAADPRLQAFAEQAAGQATVAAQAISHSLSAWNPQVGAGMKRMSEAMEELGGTTIRSTVTVVLVARGVSVDRAALLAWEPESMGDRLRAGAADVGREAAGTAVRGAIGAAIGGGRFGAVRARAPERAPTAEPQTSSAPLPSPMFRVTTTREDFAYNQTGADVVAAIMQRISNYQRRPISQ